MDVKRCIDMFNRVKTPLLGLIENMSTFKCPHCAHETDLFKKGHLESFCHENKLPILAHIPFTPEIGIDAEEGIPYVKKNPNSSEKRAFAEAAKAIIKSLN
jgi:ATP-binding protein involved in chromosome partitioning